MTYGYCPICNGLAVQRARNPHGPTTCENGHKFLHADTLSHPRSDSERHYATLRVAFRNALLRIYGTDVFDMSNVYRAIEAGMSIGDATDVLESHLRNAAELTPLPRRKRS